MLVFESTHNIFLYRRRNPKRIIKIATFLRYIARIIEHFTNKRITKTEKQPPKGTEPPGR